MLQEAELGCASLGGMSRDGVSCGDVSDTRSRFLHMDFLAKTPAVRETSVLGLVAGQLVFFFCQVNRSQLATNWEVFAYHYVNEISVLEKKKEAKRTKTREQRPKDSNSFRTWIQTERAAG